MKESNGKIGEARFALLLAGEGVAARAAEMLPGLQPTRVICAGELINQMPEMRAAADEWVCAVPLTHPMGDDPALDMLLSALSAHQEGLRSLMEHCKVSLRLYVQSDYAHVNYVLTAGTLQRLAGLGLPLEVSTISWGETGL